MADDAKSAYEHLRAERVRAIQAIEQRQRTLAYGRLATVAVAVAVVWWALAEGNAAAILWVLAPIAVFAALMVAHNRREREVDRLRRAVAFFDGGVARMGGHWAGRGQTGESYLDPAHPYALDLDLFGKGSLFELLSTARTHIGEETLARWLLAAADAETVRQRQQAVDELRPRLDLREDLAVVGEEARTGVDPVSLAAWGEAPEMLSGSTHLVLWVLTVIGVAGAVGGLLTLGGAAQFLPLSERAFTIWRDIFLVALAIDGTFLFRKRALFERVVGAVEQAAHELQLLAGVLERLERERFRSPKLAALADSLASTGGDAGAPPSQRIASLRNILQNIDSRDNVFVRVAEVFILWTPHWALAVEDWRRTSGTAVRRWLVAVGEMEALCSLASHAYENPSDPYPEFVEGPPLLEAESIGHPLIPADRVVRNSIRLGGPGGPRVLVVSGSNMSGKSTMMRTLGVNCVLAHAGAPVRAARLRLSPLSVGASIRLTDSLQEGVSRFYAEILRLRQILDLAAGGRPVLFLIDEVLHGTNSHDRRIGAEALVRGLVERGAIGLVTTHDLALAEIAAMLGERAANVHFEDRIEDGHILFDYVMRPGVVRKSNAIELMRQVGLEISTAAAMDSREVRQLALECGFELAGVARAEPAADRSRYAAWVAAGRAGAMGYLTDRRAALRDDPRTLLPSARSVISVGRLYHTPWPYSTQFDEAGRGWISRYAWGGDYHDEMRGGLQRLEDALRERSGGAMEAKICVDSAPLLERTYARLAGLGWIGKNTCLINQQRGSWFFLGELLVSAEIAPGPEDVPPPDRCGTCTRCIDACPTAALVPEGDGYTLDARLCISYLTIELRGAIPEELREGVGPHIFGCDICQDVCPWNGRAPASAEAVYEPRAFAPPLDRMAGLTESEFRALFGGTPVSRSRYAGFLRNVAIAMGNRPRPEFRAPLERLAALGDPVVTESAAWALLQMRRGGDRRR